MTKLLLCFLFSITFSSGFSQKVYFIYLQTENEQPFYVRMDKTVHSSSASGYLIVAKLNGDSVYSFTIGFPQNKWPEQKFSVAMNRKDHGYLVKNFGDKGWGLFDLQTLAVQMAIAGSARIGNKHGEDNKEVSPFTDILAKAADDPTLREKQSSRAVNEKEIGIVVMVSEKEDVVVAEIKDPVTEKPVEKIAPVIVKMEEPKAENKEPIKKPEEKSEPVIVKTEEPKVEIKEAPIKEQEETLTTPVNDYKPSTVIKRSETSTGEGLGLVFIDRDNKGTTDTISLVIPNSKPIVAVKEEPVKEEKKFIEILPDSSNVVEEKPVAKEEAQKFYHEMNNCPSLARDNDFYKLRKLMATAEGDDNMIAEAKEYFKTKCFTTQQIKNLGSLFLTDDSRYKFFVAAYNHVSDKNVFYSLQAELKEDQYISSFKAIVRN